MSLLWGCLPDREEGPEGTRNEAPVRFPKLPHYHLPPASGMGRRNRRGGRCPREVLGDARFSLREPGIPIRPWILRQLCEETQAGREEARARGCSACPSGESSRRFHGWRQERCQRDADVLHRWREIRWLSRIWSFDRGARNGRERLTATRPIAGRVSVGIPLRALAASPPFPHFDLCDRLGARGESTSTRRLLDQVGLAQERS